MHRAFILLLLAAPALAGEFPFDASHESVRSYVHGDWELRLYFDEALGGGGAEILKNEERRFSTMGWRMTAGTVGLADRGELVGRDLTGDGRPELVFSDFSGDAHCCFTTWIFSLGDSLIPLGRWEGEHSPVRLEDMDGDGLPELRLVDFVFAYWNAPYSASPRPELVFRWENDRYRLCWPLMSAARAPFGSENLMREEALYVGRLIGEAAPERSGEGWDWLPSLYWKTALDFIYTGRGGGAWEWMDTAWPEGVEGREAFLADFRERLGESRYWDELAPGIRQPGE